MIKDLLLVALFIFQDKVLATQETVGAFQKLPVVMPSVDILYSALRKAKRVSATKGNRISVALV